jgi:hypothetical protein
MRKKMTGMKGDPFLFARLGYRPDNTRDRRTRKPGDNAQMGRLFVA